MDERQADDAVITRALSLVRQDSASSTELFGAILALGRAGACWAHPDISRYLTHDDASLRQVALRSLLAHCRLGEYWDQAVQILNHDPDDAVRMTAASMLGALKRDTHDRQTLEVLAPFVADEAEDPMVREAAYLAMREIVQYDPREQLDLSARDMNLEKEVDWELVNRYLSTE